MTTMLDAGVSLRDVQIAARHADPDAVAIAGARLRALPLEEPLGWSLCNVRGVRTDGIPCRGTLPFPPGR